MNWSMPKQTLNEKIDAIANRLGSDIQDARNEMRTAVSDARRAASRSTLRQVEEEIKHLARQAKADADAKVAAAYHVAKNAKYGRRGGLNRDEMEDQGRGAYVAGKWMEW